VTVSYYNQFLGIVKGALWKI